MLGPPHSGKSVFSYLLFKSLRDRQNDAALIDCDVYSPTVRPYKLASAEEDKHVYVPPNSGKLEVSIDEQVYSSVIDFNFIAVREQGVIVLDGLGKHTEMTEVLLKKAGSLAIICREPLLPDEMLKYGYVNGTVPEHPFIFYEKKIPRPLKVTTHLTGVMSSFTIGSLEGVLCGLDRNEIKEGVIHDIPADSISQISSIASLLDSNLRR